MKQSISNYLLKLSIFCVALVILAGLAFSAVPLFAYADDSFSAFSKLPANWELSELCDTENVTIGASSGHLSVKSTSTQTMSKYYGALVRIGTDKTYGDFTFEMTFRMSDPADNSRWLGIMYHTQTASNGKLIGYMMNLRYSGESASSAVTPSLSFLDDTKKASGVSLADGLFHTITITLSGTSASHYIDGNLITEWNVSSKDSKIGTSLNEGGFALIVNRSTVTIKSVNISDKIKTPTPIMRETDNKLAETYAPKTELVSPATVVTDINSLVTLQNLTDINGHSPASVILHIDDNLNVIDANGGTLGTLYDIYKGLNNKIIPIISVESEKAANAFIDFMCTKLYILDIAVMSKDANLVKKVRGELIGIRGIVEYEKVNSLYEIVRESTEAGAMTVILPQKDADSASVNYLQARFKTVWVRADSNSSGDISDSIFGGAFGVIADYSAVYDLIETLSGYTRNIFNVAHRGLRKVYNENGLHGLEASMRAGVTHVELDAMLTKDKEVVIMHDDTINRTTNGTGNIKDKTLDELRQYILNDRDSSAGETIPTLKDVIKTMKGLNEENGTDVVLILEIKADDLDLVPKIKEILDKENFYENIVFITFDSAEHQLAALRDNMPWVPASGLDSVSVSNFASQLGGLNAAHAGVDPSKGNFSTEFIKMLTDRGFTPWSWTFDEVGSTTNTTFDGVKQGLLGVTSDEADIYSNMVQYAYGNDSINVLEDNVPAVGDTLPISLVYYSGNIEIGSAVIYSVEKTDWGWQCLATYTIELQGVKYYMYLRAINYYAPVPEQNNLWLIILLPILGSAVVAGVGATIFVVLKKKKSQKKFQ